MNVTSLSIRQLDTGLRITWSVAAVVLAAALVWLLSDPLAQDLGYHQFADQRSLLGVPHGLNVLSNLAFCLVGTWGCALLARRARNRPISFNNLIYLVFFVGLFGTGLGSAYYHLAPGNATLVWDRLPMTVAFMAFTAVVIAERCSALLARRLFPWLLLAGVLSVIYWAWTDDLRPYFLIQFGPMLVLPVVIWRSSGSGTRWLWLTVAFYGAAKLLELGDDQILMLSEGLVSGHTLKHLAAAAGASMIVCKLRLGRRADWIDRPSPVAHGSRAARRRVADETMS
jgi:hypothetical protein